LRLTSRQTAVCGVLCALATALLLMGSIIPLAVYCCPLLAMLVLLPVREEFGVRWALTAYGAVALLSLFLVADKELAGVYVFFGWYPAVQPSLNRLNPAPLRRVVKLLAANGALAALYALLIWVFQLEALTAEFSGFSAVFVTVLLVMSNAVFFCADRVFASFPILWRRKLRRHWFRGM
jgi:hypothetical protein